MAKNITIYHNNQCSKSREALEILKSDSSEFEVIEYLKDTLDKEELSDLLSKLGISAHTLMRKGEQDYKDFVKGKNLSETEMIELMANYPKLIERPIIVRDNKAIIGRPTSLIIDFIN